MPTDISQISMGAPKITSTASTIQLQSAGNFVLPSWGCSIPYVIDSSIKYPDQVQHAIDYLSKITDYSFHPKGGLDISFINFLNDNTGCHTDTLGAAAGQVNVHIGEYCDELAIMHEIGHALGLTHEMSRPDRDKYITSINKNNIIPTDQIQYDISQNYSAGDFDYKSMMMYDQYSFTSNNQPTMTFPLGVTQFVGGRTEVRIQDVQNINLRAHNASCPAKSQKPPCNKTDITFDSGNGTMYFVINGNYNLQTNGSYVKEFYHLGTQPILSQDSTTKIWYITHQDVIYAQSDKPDLLTTTWTCLDSITNKLVSMPYAKVNQRDCTFPNLAGYSVRVPFALSVEYITYLINNYIGVFIMIIILLAFLTAGLLYGYGNIVRLFVNGMNTIVIDANYFRV